MASPAEKESTQPKAPAKKGEMDLAVRSSPLPGNRPIVPTNKDDSMDDFVGYMD